MLIPNQLIKVKWHYTNKDYYVSKGYVFTHFNDDFYVKAEHLNPTSHIKVKVKCDHCDKEFMRSYRDYIKEHSQLYGDCCRIHSRLKAKDTCQKLYGVDWVMQYPDFKEKQKNTCQMKYGVDYISQDKNFRQKVIESVQTRYGVDNVSQLPEIREKVAKSFYKNNTCATSKAQIELNNLLSNLYNDSKLNYPLGRYLLDSFIIVNGVKIDVEYDGQYWHSLTKNRDQKRNEYVLSCGYKILRFIGTNKLPSIVLIKNSIDTLVNTNTDFLEIVI